MTNIEIKAKYRKSDKTQRVLEKIGARFERVEMQTDTYFNVENGKLKIRERDSGLSQLIQYFRKDDERPKPSYYEIVHLRNVKKVKETLTREYGIRAIVRKKRDIWTWKNVRIHFDAVEDLGHFLEFEAVIEKDTDDEEGYRKLKRMMKKFGITRKDLVSHSYGDLIEL